MGHVADECEKRIKMNEEFAYRYVTGTQSQDAEQMLDAPGKRLGTNTARL